MGCHGDRLSQAYPENMAKYMGRGYSRDECVFTCKLMGYKYAGLQNGSYCSCDHDFGDVPSSVVHRRRRLEVVKMPDGNCNTKCDYVGVPAKRADDTDASYCGGAITNDVYNLRPPKEDFTPKNRCETCWCEGVDLGGLSALNLGDDGHPVMGTYTGCQLWPSTPASLDAEGLPTPGVNLPYGGENGFKCKRDAGSLVFVARNGGVYESRKQGMCPSSEHITGQENWGNDFCVAFPWTGGVTYHNPFAPLAKILKLFGEIMFCNRPVAKSSFLTVSTAKVGAISFTGRIDWDCEMGPFEKDCGISGGMISITREFDMFKKKKTNKVKFDDNHGKNESHDASVTGSFSLTLGLHRNKETLGLDIRIGASGGVKVALGPILNAEGLVAGWATIHTKPAECVTDCGVTVDSTFKIEASLQVLFCHFKIAIRFGWEGIGEEWAWWWQLTLPVFEGYAEGHEFLEHMVGPKQRGNLFQRAVGWLHGRF
jgi:hypothetical protein